MLVVHDSDVLGDELLPVEYLSPIKAKDKRLQAWPGSALWLVALPMLVFAFRFWLP